MRAFTILQQKYDVVVAVVNAFYSIFVFLFAVSFQNKYELDDINYQL